MPIPATITIDLADRIAVAQLAAVLLALAATAEKSAPAMTFTPPSGPAEPKQKRTKADKSADKPAEDKPVEAPKQETIPEVADKPAVEGPANTQAEPTQNGADELRAALLAVIQNPKLGPPKAGQILTAHGAKNASTVPADKRGAVIADLKAALEGAK